MELLRFKSHLQSQWGSAAIFRFSKPPQNSNQSQALCTMYTIEAVDIDWDVQAVEVMQFQEFSVPVNDKKDIQGAVIE